MGAMASAIDWGDTGSELGNIHPRHKRVVGERLALAATGLAYATGTSAFMGPSLVAARALSTEAVLPQWRKDSFVICGPPFPLKWNISFEQCYDLCMETNCTSFSYTNSR